MSFNVGANIGLFSLFANQICKNPKIYAFEPNRAVFKLLEANVSLYGSEIHLFQLGMVHTSKTATFTFFRGSSIQSGFYVDAAKEKAIAKTVIMNQQKKEVVDMAEFFNETDSVLDQRYSPETYTVQLTTLSKVIEKEDIDCIHLLKINVEKSELDVIKGIRDNDWEKIKQIIVKVDLQKTLDLILSVLIEKGYDVVVDRDALLENTQIHTVYAIRPSNKRMLIKQQEQGAHIRPLPALDNPLISAGEMQQSLSKALPDYMIPSTFVFLERLPLTISGKVDRRALPEPPHERPELEEIFLAPENNIEIQLTKIWESVLDRKGIGVNDIFFELGGDSLSATRIISRIRDAFHVEIPLESSFEQPTVSGLDELIDTMISVSKDSRHLHNAASDSLEEGEL